MTGVMCVGRGCELARIHFHAPFDFRLSVLSASTSSLGIYAIHFVLLEHSAARRFGVQHELDNMTVGQPFVGFELTMSRANI